MRVQVIEVAEEFVEAVNGGKKLIAVSQMVLAELAGGVAERLERLGNRHIFLLQTFWCARQTNLGEAGADGRLPGDERGAPCGAALLGIPVGENRPLMADAVNVWRLVAHH